MYRLIKKIHQIDEAENNVFDYFVLNIYISSITNSIHTSKRKKSCTKQRQMKVVYLFPSADNECNFSRVADV